MRLALAIAPLLAALLLVACNGGSDDSGSPQATPAPAADQAQPDAVADVAEQSQPEPRPERPPPPRDERPDERPEETPDRDAEPIATPDEEPEPDEPPFDLFEVDTVVIPPLRGGLQVAIRTATHDGFDRIVFEFLPAPPEAGDFDEGLPHYRIEYPDEPVACGSGFPVDFAGGGGLEIDFLWASAHDVFTGEPTLQEQDVNLGPTIQSVDLTCDFEALVTWVFGLDERAPFRIFELANPTRLVIDVQH